MATMGILIGDKKLSNFRFPGDIIFSDNESIKDQWVLMDAAKFKVEVDGQEIQ